MSILYQFDNLPWSTIDENRNKYYLGHSMISAIMCIDKINNPNITMFLNLHKVKLENDVFLKLINTNDEIIVLVSGEELKSYRMSKKELYDMITRVLDNLLVK